MEHILDHDAQAKARLLEQYKGKPKLVALIGALATQVQELEDAAYAILAQRTLDGATGVQLDALGRIVGQRRDGADDETYRRFVKARIKLNRTSGTLEQLLDIVRLIATDGSLNFTFSEDFPAAFTLNVAGAPLSPALAAQLASFVRAGRAGGVRGIVEWFESDAVDAFRFDIGPGFDVGHLAGATV